MCNKSRGKNGLRKTRGQRGHQQGSGGASVDVDVVLGVHIPSNPPVGRGAELHWKGGRPPPPPPSRTPDAKCQPQWHL